MSVIISDTTPLRYLIEIEAVHILESLFGKVIIPEKVAEELQRPKTPQKVKDWMEACPGWLEVKRADLSLFTPHRKIGDGEREALALALELRATAVLLDDNDAEKEAQRLKISFVRLFGIFERASEAELLDCSKAIEDLRDTNFRLPPEEIIEAFLERDRKRQEERGRLNI
jgi:predicted nucleic acid-binding protein